MSSFNRYVFDARWISLAVVEWFGRRAMFWFCLFRILINKIVNFVKHLTEYWWGFLEHVLCRGFLLSQIVRLFGKKHFSLQGISQTKVSNLDLFLQLLVHEEPFLSSSFSAALSIGVSSDISLASRRANPQESLALPWVWCGWQKECSEMWAYLDVRFSGRSLLS